MKRIQSNSRRHLVAKIGAAAVLAVAGFAAVSPASAAPVYVDIRLAPPPLRHEVIPAPRPGYIWAPGYWDWRQNRHYWVGGRWIAERPGYTYVQPTWVQQGPRWHYYPGNWARRDMDRDGVRNRYDRDRDGDGVPNRYDRRPNNPYRR